MDDETMIVDDGDLRKYRIELPNLIDDLPLTPYAFRLYVHIKRRAGATASGYCWASVRTMAKDCRMSVDTAHKAKYELRDAGLITIEHQITEKGEKPKTDIIRIVDIWGRNFAHFATPLALTEANDPVRIANDPVRIANDPVRVAELKKEPCKKEPIEEKGKRRGAPGALCPECKTPGEERSTSGGKGVWCPNHGLKLLSPGASPVPKSSAPDALLHNPAVALFKSVHGFYPKAGVPRERIALRVEDLALWKSVLETCVMRGRKPTDVDLQLGWYANGIPQNGYQVAPGKKPREPVIPG